VHIRKKNRGEKDKRHMYTLKENIIFLIISFFDNTTTFDR
jgi:hypothetical protein